MASASIQSRSTPFAHKDANEASENKTLVYLSPAERHSIQFRIALVTTTCLAFATRFWKLSHPDEVVFDEVHFVNFASYYLQRTYFFDVHPPLGKLMFALVGWLVGYNGSFLFDNIGDLYIRHNTPYTMYRSLSALLSSCTVPIVFLIMQEARYSLSASILAASIVLFDNAQVTVSRLIMLDAILVFSIACALYSYIRFRKQSHSPFSYLWWKWLFLTGVALSCAISTKYVGVLTFVTIGIAVVIDLWNLLDIKHGLSIQGFIRHIVYRLFCLTLVPFLIYLFWFYIHFKILTNHGPGDAFMTDEFRETLEDNALPEKALPVHYFDKIVLKHRNTRVFLHSHAERYCSTNDSGQVLSQRQEVTTVLFEDYDNVWFVLPENNEEKQNSERPVRYNDKVRFLHASTKTILLSYNVTSLLHLTYQEFVTVPLDQLAGRHSFTLFQLKPVHHKPDDIIHTKLGVLRVVHMLTNAAMCTHNDRHLFERNFGQQAINGNLAITQKINSWIFDIIVDVDTISRLGSPVQIVKPMSFFKKWMELQTLIFAYNSALTSDHPYASRPMIWPMTFRGVAFWSKELERKQIYFHGNILGWWLEILALVFFVSHFVVDRILLKRNASMCDDNVRRRLYTSSGFFALAWATHFLPFFFMARQLFLHHYLPAHLCLAPFTGTIFDLLSGFTHRECALKQSINDIKNLQRSKDRKDIANVKESGFKKDDISDSGINESYFMTMSFVIALAGIFIYFSPLTYGTPGLPKPYVSKRALLGFQLQFNN